MKSSSLTKGNGRFGASNENFQISWLETSKNSKKFTFKDILNYSGEGFLKIYWFLDKSDLDEVSEVLSKYKRNVVVIPTENFPVIDGKGRLQLSSKRSFAIEGLGLGSFAKTMHEKGYFASMKKQGVKYIYMQPLTNLQTRIIDFDLLDIMLSTSQPGASKIFSSQYRSNTSLKSFKVNNQDLIFSVKETNPKTIKKISTNNFKIFSSSELNFEKKKPRKFVKNKNPELVTSVHKKMVTSIQSISEDDINFDCISKIYDLEGNLALKIHDAPTDCLNSIKFFDPERGTNWSKLHSGEAVYHLDRFLSRRFWRDYNSCK
jgi:hypothetical protein